MVHKRLSLMMKLVMAHKTSKYKVLVPATLW